MVSSMDGSRLMVRLEVLDRQDGVYIVRFKLYRSVEDIKLVVTYHGHHVAVSPYYIQGITVTILLL